jgi:hypothetical protein
MKGTEYFVSLQPGSAVFSSSPSRPTSEIILKQAMAVYLHIAYALLFKTTTQFYAYNRRV